MVKFPKDIRFAFLKIAGTMSRRVRIFLAVASGLILSLGWFQWASGLFILAGFIPLLFVEDFFLANKNRYASVNVFLYAWLAFGIWNLADTWWIWNATAVGMVAAVVINSFLMALIFWLFHLVRRAVPGKSGYFALIVFWTYWEYFYLNAEISWPWLNLGNAFANDTGIIQWYEYTGTLGGTVWVLVANVLLFGIIQHLVATKKWQGKVFDSVLAAIWIFVPVIISQYIFHSYKEKGKPYNVVVIQPNIDPYEKFVALSSEFQTQRILDLASLKADTSVDYFVAPETALNNDIWIDHLEENTAIQAVRRFLKPYPRAKFVVGITGYKSYNPGEKLTPTARPLGTTGLYYDSFNSAIQIDSTPHIPIYHKSKLVVGVEKMPYPQYLGFLRKITLRLGGTFRSHATQPYRSVLRSPQDSMGVATVICYESVFGEFVTDYLKCGNTGFIFVMTNDGWWGNTPGYRQHFSFSRLRAIETRRDIARSANTGISGFINQRGDVLEKVGWWEPASLRREIYANTEMTYYAKHGDYLGRMAGWFSLLTALAAITHHLMNKRKKTI
jgi:apolipoprotein N-acyltransferase